MAGSEDRSLFMFEAARAWGGGGTGKGVEVGRGWQERTEGGADE